VKSIGNTYIPSLAETNQQSLVIFYLSPIKLQMNYQDSFSL